MDVVEPLFDLAGRRALVTAAGQNLGEGIARTLGRIGAEVVVNDLVAERAGRSRLRRGQRR